MIIVNGRFMTQALTGVQRYARGITTALLSLRDDIQVVVPGGADILSDYEAIPYKRVGRLQGHAWEQFTLPRYVMRERAALLGLASTGPVLLKRQIVTNHDITYVRYPDSFSRAFRFLYRSMSPVLLRSSARVITVSEFSREEISEFYRINPMKFSVVANATDAQFSPGIPSEYQKYILAVSSPSAHKNFGRLLEAYTLLPEENRPDLLVVGGTAPALVRPALAQAPGVRFLGRVDDAQLPDLYRGAQAFVFPSLYEGFGIPPLEAQACGTPVLAADIPATREVLQDSARYFDPQSPRSLAESIQEIAEATAAERQQVIQSGFANVQRFSWEASAMKVSEILDREFGRSRSSNRARP